MARTLEEIPELFDSAVREAVAAFSASLPRDPEESMLTCLAELFQQARRGSGFRDLEIAASP